MNARRIVGFLALALLAGAAAQATTMVRAELEDLASAATLVVRVKCLGTESRWEQGRIWTFTRFETGETFKGGAPREITVRLLGGRVGHLTARVEGIPRFEAGEETVLFLEPTEFGDLTVTSWAQGTFRIRRADVRGETVTQDTGAVTLFDPETRRFSRGGVRQMPYEEFKQRVAAAVEKQRQRRQP